MEQILVQEESPVVMLKNGTRASRAMVKEVMHKLHHIMTKEPNGAFLLNDLVMKCQDEAHRCFFHGCQGKLTELGFLDIDGVVKPSMRDIILSSITGSGPDLGFGSPIKAD